MTGDTRKETLMATLNPYLTFDGDCASALAFYKECLGGELKIMTVGASPVAASMPRETHSSVMHGLLEADGIRIMASDMLGDDKLKRGNTISLMLLCGSEAELRDLFGKLSRGGTVNAPVKAEFWGAIYGDLTDKFGIRWMLNYDKPGA
jgi:PhnB protein